MSPGELYRTLEDGASVTLPAEALREAERAGFVGIRLEGSSIRAWKGKDGPCHDTGRTAEYRGGAAAAMDDDAHLLVGRMRLCEKTARIYRTAYAGVVEVSEPDPALMARLDRDPAPFDCDTFEADARALAARLEAPGPGDERVALLYPGPFRRLILADGTIVPRGRAVAVARRHADALVAKDGARLVDGDAPAPENYARLFRERGPAALLAPDEGAPLFRPAAGEDAALFRRALIGTSEPMRRRLRALLERGEEYFILVGSDPSDQDGCCPSDDVGAANALVRAGVLEAWCSSPAAACPATVYAFAGEIRSGGERPSFTRNEAVRARALDLLRSNAGRARRAAVRIVLWALLAFGAGVLIWSLWDQWSS
ncbi:MAG TPA: hypothetical protein VEJ18_01665 [Planctomycetota bacterium]|nr:hypothetical protein [Planctomycetota bacterium]